MAGKKSGGENTKKVAGNAKKAEAAAQKQAVKDKVVAENEDAEWSKGAKDNKKQYVNGWWSIVNWRVAEKRFSGGSQDIYGELAGLSSKL